MAAFDIDDVGETSSGPPALRYDGVSDDIPGLPSRSELIRLGDGATRVAADEAVIAAGAPLYFMPNDTHEDKCWVDGSPTYQLHLFGVLPSGAKAHVVLTGIEVYFDVRVAPGADPAQFRRHLRVAMSDKDNAPLRTKIHKAFPIRGFREEPVSWIRLYYSTTKERKDALVYIHEELEYETASDDRSAYYRMVARDHGLSLTDWGTISGYTHFRGGAHPEGASSTARRCQSPLCEHLFFVDVKDLAPLVPPAGTKEEQERGAAEKKANGLTRDRTLVLAWDIETYDSAGTGALPRATRNTSCIFSIGITVHWKDDPRPLCGVFLSEIDAAPDERWASVVCGSELNLLKAFGVVLHRIAPDFVVGFNDADYDWPFLITRAQTYDILGWFADRASAISRWKPTSSSGAFRWNVQSDKPVKLGADNTAHLTFLKVPGSIPFDVRTVFRQLFPKAEVGKSSGLNFYLETCKISSKADLSYKAMWAIYKRRDTEQMRVVAHYNIIDSLRCQQLLVKRNIINDRREVSAIAYTSLFDALYYAGGMKVRNLLIATAGRKGYLCSNYGASEKRGGKYPGAWVFPPEKGLNPDPTEKTLVDLEAARARFLAAVGQLETKGDAGGDDEGETKVADDEGADAGGGGAKPAPAPEDPMGPARTAASPEIAAAIKTHADMRAWAGSLPGGTPQFVLNELEAARAQIEDALRNYDPKRPATGLDFSSLYPSIIMTYNLSPEKYVATAAQAAELTAAGHDLYHTQFLFEGETVEGWFVRHGNRPEDIGIYPTILLDLFNRRKAMKKRLIALEEQIEHMDLVLGETEKCGDFAAAFRAERRSLQTRRDDLVVRMGRLGPERAKERAYLESEAHEVAENLGYMELLLAPGDERASKRANRGDGAGGGNAEPEAAELRARFDAYYEDASFEFMQIDAKQKALKVFMNTFYGEAGNQRSAFFLLQLAGGVTTAGQYNIKKVDAYVRSKGFRVKYGDTDSVYVCAPNAAFAEFDRAYAFGLIDRETYWARLVTTTMAELRPMRDAVNEALRADNGTGYLKVAYEEVLWPYFLLGKKKYGGIPHVAQPNFRPKKLFMRGIDIVKQGQTDYAKKIGNDIMWASVSLTNERSMMGIVQDTLRDAVLNVEQWKFADFVRSAAWKPHKDNKSVQSFIRRMRAEVAREAAANERRAAAGEERRPALYYIPDPGDRFRFVMVRLASAFSLRGLKVTGKVGDVMEYVEVAQAKDLPVDIARYLKSFVVGLCARFVSFEDQFAPAAPLLAAMDPKVLDETTSKAAKKFLVQFIQALQGESTTVARKRGYAYRRAWKKAAADCVGRVHAAAGGVASEVLQGEYLDWELFLAPEADSIVAALGAQARLAAAADHGADVAAFLACRGVDATTGGDLDADGARLASDGAQNLYALADEMGATPPRRARGRRRRLRPRDRILQTFNLMEEEARARLEGLVDTLRDVATRYELSVTAIVEQYRVAEHAERGAELGASYKKDAGGEWAFDLSPAERRCLEEVRRVWYTLVGIYRERDYHAQLDDILGRLKERRVRRVALLPRGERVRASREASIPADAPRVSVIGDGGY